MIKRLLFRLARDLSLIPLLAFVIYQLVAHLPFKADVERKNVEPGSIQRQMDEQLGLGEPLGFLRPWQLLLEGERLGTESRRYDAKDLWRALSGSLRIGGMALLLSLLLATAFASARALLRRRAADHLLELIPTLVYGTPTFVLALVVAMFTSVSLDDDQASFEPIAAAVISVGPGIFMGVILFDALRAEMNKPYVTTAIAKGRRELDAMLIHALPNAIPALLDAIPPVATAMLAGSFVVEKLFNVTYFGLLYVFAAQNKQIALVVVGTTIFAAILIGVTMVVDVLRILIDPRARGQAMEGSR